VPSVAMLKLFSAYSQHHTLFVKNYVLVVLTIVQK